MRLFALGHEVVVLYALVSPVHRNGRPMYPSPESTPTTNAMQNDIAARFFDPDRAGSLTYGCR